jgi:hypothetical protein
VRSNRRQRLAPAAFVEWELPIDQNWLSAMVSSAVQRRLVAPLVRPTLVVLLLLQVPGAAVPFVPTLAVARPKKRC